MFHVFARYGGLGTEPDSNQPGGAAAAEGVTAAQEIKKKTERKKEGKKEKRIDEGVIGWVSWSGGWGGGCGSLLMKMFHSHVADESDRRGKEKRMARERNAAFVRLAGPRREDDPGAKGSDTASIPFRGEACRTRPGCQIT